MFSHNPEETKCPKCPKVLHSKYALTQHLREQHNKKKNFKCIHCGICRLNILIVPINAADEYYMIRYNFFKRSSSNPCLITMWQQCTKKINCLDVTIVDWGLLPRFTYWNTCQHIQQKNLISANCVAEVRRIIFLSIVLIISVRMKFV